MSVIVSKRSASKLEYYHTARAIRRNLTMLFLQTFHLNSGIRMVFPSPKEFEDCAPAKKFLPHYRSLQSRCRELEATSKYSKWLLEMYRTQILADLKRLIDLIVQAENIEPIYVEEALHKRTLQTEAIGICLILVEDLQHLCEILPININKLEPYISQIRTEIGLLRSWRRETNRKIATLQK